MQKQEIYVLLFAIRFSWRKNDNSDNVYNFFQQLSSQNYLRADAPAVFLPMD